jgi:hypothetical protein
MWIQEKKMVPGAEKSIPPTCNSPTIIRAEGAIPYYGVNGKSIHPNFMPQEHNLNLYMPDDPVF